MIHWYAIHTKPRSEKEAQENLMRQSYEVYLPLIKIKKFVRKRWQDRIEALFPRYLFVRLDLEQTNTAPIRHLQNYIRICSLGHRSVPVPDEIIEFLQSSADPVTGIHQSLEPAIKSGEKISIVAGPLHGVEGVFESENGDERAMILVNVLGRINKITVAQKDIAPTPL